MTEITVHCRVDREMVKDKAIVNLGKSLRCRHRCGTPLGSLFGLLATASVSIVCSPEHLKRDLTERGNLVEEGKGRLS